LTELVWRDSRARFMADKYLQRFGKRQNEVLAAGEELKLVEAGNHAQGCIFREGMRPSTPALTESVDTISQRLTVFFIGRYDIRYANEEDLRAGKKLSNHRTERRGLRSNEYLRRVQLDLCRLSDAFPAVEFGLRHRRGESEARLRANEAFARLPDYYRQEENRPQSSRDLIPI